MFAERSKIQINNGRIESLVENGNALSIVSDEFQLNFPAGATAYPGFVDSHGHIAGYGMRRSENDLSRAESFDECIEIMKKSSLTRGDWLVGYGWNQENWADKSFPSAKALDSAFPDIPVFLLRIDGHSAVINSKAMSIAQIGDRTPDPDGGKIDRNKAGQATGVLIDNAIKSAESLIPEYSFEQQSEFIRTAVNELPKFGITEVHDMDVDTSLIPIYQDMEFRKELPLRILAYAKAQNNEWLRDSVIAYSGNMYSVKGLKYYADGALGSRGAALLRHYEDDSSTEGVLLMEDKNFFSRAKRGIFSGFDIAVHCIGDRGVRFALDGIEKLRKDPMLKGRGNFRIEHSQIVHPDDLPRFKQLNVAASVQPVHFTMDTQGMAQKRLGPKIKNSYLWKSFLNEGAQLIAGSDFPIETPSPIEGIRAFLHRLPFGTNEALFPEEKLSLNEALDAYCSAPHRVTGNEKQRGGIIGGKQADITVLSDSLDVLVENPSADIHVLATIINGKIAYKA